LRIASDLVVSYSRIIEFRFAPISSDLIWLLDNPHHHKVIALTTPVVYSPATLRRRIANGLECPTLLALTAICQVLAGRAHEWSLLPDDATILAPFLTIPHCDAPIEDLVAQCVLRAFLEKLHRVIHANFHARLGTECHLDLLPVPAWSPAMSVVQVVGAWIAHVRSDFSRHHHPVEIAKAMILERLASPPNTTDLARAIGLSRRALERSFRATSKQSIVEFRSRERVRMVERLVTEGVKVEAAAHLVGWKSKKDMYRAFNQVLGRTPLVPPFDQDPELPGDRKARQTREARSLPYHLASNAITRAMPQQIVNYRKNGKTRL
jgi:AraC-like DNA-binding protein